MEDERLRIVLKNGEVLLADSVSMKMNNDILFFFIPISVKDNVLSAVLYRYDVMSISTDVIEDVSIIEQMKEFCDRMKKGVKYHKTKRKYKNGRNIINLIVANWSEVKDSYKFKLDVERYI